MKAPFIHLRFLLVLTVMSVITISCKKKDDPQPSASLRAPIDYNLLKSTTPYKQYFVDAKGDSTVDRTEGRALLRMLTAIHVYCKSAVIDSAVLSNMFHNKSSAFAAPYTDLNGLNYSIQQYTATSTNFKANTDKDFEKMFGAIAKASLSSGSNAAPGSAGIYQDGNAKYLVDTAGVEYAEVIANAFIGALQLDYISNVLLFTGINADNHSLTPGKNYTPLEHNWDIAYGLFTSNDIYALGATDAALNPGESFIGAYLWENTNKDYYKNVYLAFLRGRAAIVNNDIGELRKQSVFIRNALETAIGNSGSYYILKAGIDPTISSKVHSFGKGYGFIYAMRFCSLNGGNVPFSEAFKSKFFTPTVTRFINIEVPKFHEAANDINVKFRLF